MSRGDEHTDESVNGTEVKSLHRQSSTSDLKSAAFLRRSDCLSTFVFL